MISVCIATYNGEKEIKRQLDSILLQLSGEDEVIISDDNSIDKTRSIILSYNDPRIKLLGGPCLGSPIPNFENALKHAKGDYIFLSDQDDVWLPNKVEVMLDALKSYACVVSDCFVTDSALNITCDSFYKLNNTRKSWFNNLLIKNGYLGCCMAFSRKVLEKSLPFPANIPMHDIWIGNIAAMYFNTVFIPDKLIYFCRHDHNASVTARRSTYSSFKKLQFRLSMVCNLFLTFFRK